MISVGAIVFNPSILFIFKYFTFFVRAFIGAFLFFESGGVSIFMLKILLPVDISFYAFTTLSYSIDM